MELRWWLKALEMTRRACGSDGDARSWQGEYTGDGPVLMEYSSTGGKVEARACVCMRFRDLSWRRPVVTSRSRVCC